VKSGWLLVDVSGERRRDDGFAATASTSNAITPEAFIVEVKEILH
jgi:hypothetical protein